MGFFKNMVDWFSSSPVPSANTVEEAMAGAMPNYEPKEVPMKDERKPVKLKKTKHTKASLNKMTKKQLEALGRNEFSIELDRRKSKAKLVTELLGTIKKAG